MGSTPRLLWHYTCDHGAAAIRRERLIKPNPHPFLGALAVAWFTDLEPAYRFEIGLTSDRLACDRMAHRFPVRSEGVEWWPKAARRLAVPVLVRAEMETGRLPAHWWVSLTPVEIAGGGNG